MASHPHVGITAGTPESGVQACPVGEAGGARSLRCVVEDSGRWAYAYVDQASLAPALSRDEALSLLRRVAQGGDDARSDLMTAYRRLVVSIARRFVPGGQAWTSPSAAPPDDLQHLAPLLRFGEQGLRTAIDRFDEAKGFAFRNYATWWIEQAITRGGLGNLGGAREPRSPGPDSPTGLSCLTLPVPIPKEVESGKDCSIPPAGVLTQGVEWVSGTARQRRRRWSLTGDSPKRHQGVVAS